MKVCHLVIKDGYPYEQVEDASKCQVLMTLIYCRCVEGSVKTLATVDTGFDGGLLMSRDVRDVIFAESGPPNTDESLSAGLAETPCEAFLDAGISMEGSRIEECGFRHPLSRPIR